MAHDTGRTADATGAGDASAALHESDERLRLALDVAELEAWWEWDLVTGAGEMGARAAAIVELPAGHVASIAAAQRALVHPDDLAQLQAAVAAGVARGGGFTLAYRVVRSDGSIRHVLSRARVVADAAGRPVGVFGTNRDVTAEREAEGALRASEARHAFLLSLSDALRSVDEPQAIQAEACRRLGEGLAVDRAYYVDIDESAGVASVARDWVCDASTRSLAGEHRLSDFAWSIAILRRGESYAIADTQDSPRVPPAERPAVAAIQLVANIGAPLVKGGRLVGALCVSACRPRAWTADEMALVQEVAERTWEASERARAEAALRAEELRLRMIANVVPDLLWRSEPDGAITWYNDRWYAYTGQTPAEAAGHVWGAVVHADDLPGSQAAFGDALAAERAFRVKQRMRRADGAYRWFLIQCAPLCDATGRLTQWFGAATDVHAEHEALAGVERQVAERTAALADANAALAAEAGERAQLSADRDALRRQLADAEEAERRRIARELHDQLGQHLTAFTWGLDEARRLTLSEAAAQGRLAEQLAQLQELARTMTRDARYLALELRPPELDDVGLESALDTYLREWSARYGISAEFALTGAARHRPIRDEIASALYRIAQEALTNVAKHAGASHVSVILDKPDGEIRLIVEDDGGGFEPAATAVRARAQRRLGLAGMRERATLAAGTLTVESTPGGGTTLYARLPICASSVTPGAGPDRTGKRS